MVTVNPTAWLVPDLELPYGGRTYLCRPPTVARQATCRAVHKAMQDGDDTARIIALAGTTLPQAALGDDVVNQLNADGAPTAVIDRLALIALFVWVDGGSTERAARLVANLNTAGAAA